MTIIYPVIMSGGSGTRMWPLSRKARPKQYHALVTERSLLQETLLRLDAPQMDFKIGAPSFVCAAHHEALITEQCAQAGGAPHKIILEPFGRNTAPVAAIAAQVIGESDEDALILLLAADHHIDDKDGFWRCVSAGVDAAKDGQLTVLGIQPSRPETGFGYIKRGAAMGEDVYGVQAFVEKPDSARAQAYLDSGEYFWNAGIFLFSAKAMNAAFETHAPDILAASKATLAASDDTQNVITLDPTAFRDCRSESLDYAIMEAASNVAMVAPVDVGWNDIGSWSALAQMSHKRDDMEPEIGDVVSIDCKNNYIRASEGVTVAAIGLDNIVIVATGDAVLVMAADKAQDVKKVIAQLKAKDATELL
ncbi:MAG: mannose-1-phosphate guanylyltransferase/mannose-6-phosphate isomerase [Robiginitomaculum sp.]